MGEQQWFQPTVRNKLSQAIVLVNFSLQYGKFYDISEHPHHFHPPRWQISSLDNRFNEIATPDRTNIPGEQQNEWGSCGWQATPTGTEGSFEVHLADGDEKIAEVYWDCPYMGSNNQIVKRYVKPGYDVSFDGFNMSGALGNGNINVQEN